MSRYAIKVVPPEWQDTMPLPFNKTTHDYSKIEQGTRVLVYRSGEGIVGEGDVEGYFVRPHEWPTESAEQLPPALAQADYLLPIAMLYLRERVISPDKVRDLLDDRSFPQGIDTWRPIGLDLYDELTHLA
ncbi:MAG: hypothetical protein GC204_09755 [Chloroflexi bacterium]|nr:hypothetical protein [Chloroflexota bacterium]